MSRFGFLALFFASYLTAQPLEIDIKGEVAILMNAKSGKVLYEKNAHMTIFPASTTKIATALLLLDKMGDQLDKTVVAERESIASITPQAKKQSNFRSPAYWLETDATHVGIKRGEEIRYYDLMYMLMLASGNDAANVIAQGISSTIPRFMDEVNSYLESIGCKNTHFVNPHGLHHPKHVSSAYDLALMARVGLKNPLFRQVVSTVRYTAPETNLELARPLAQLNLLLKKGTYYYPKAIGVKTGFTQTAGKNLVAAAADSERELIAVALGYKGSRAELYQDLVKMFESAFNEPKMRRLLLEKGEQSIVAQVPGAKKKLTTTLAEPLSYDFYPSEEMAVKVVLNWQIPPLPIPKGARVAEVKVVDELGLVVNQVPLYAAEELLPTLRQQLKDGLAKNRRGRKMAFFGSATLLFLFLWRLRRTRSA